MGFDKKAFWCYNYGMGRTADTGDGRGLRATVLETWLTQGSLTILNLV